MTRNGPSYSNDFDCVGWRLFDVGATVDGMVVNAFVAAGTSKEDYYKEGDVVLFREDEAILKYSPSAFRYRYDTDLCEIIFDDISYSVKSIDDAGTEWTKDGVIIAMEKVPSEKKRSFKNAIYKYYVSPTSDNFVDLGGGLLWSKDYIRIDGEYAFCGWGEPMSSDLPSPEKGYLWKKDGKYTKYNSSDGKTCVERDNDLASLVWGGHWRMPTSDEIRQMINACTWTYSYSAGKEVMTGKSRTTGEKITFTSTGYYEEGSTHYNSPMISFWAADKPTSTDGFAYLLMKVIDDGGSESMSVTEMSRTYRLPVRPVIESKYAVVDEIIN